MIEQAKNICIELLRMIKNPSPQDVTNSIDNVLKIFPDLFSERETLFRYLSATFSVFSENYRILDTDVDYHPWLKDSKANITWNFWNRYISYLQKKIAPDTINKLDNLTDDILDRIANPITSGAWDKRGMVVGQVQSGKTSNYIGLINKASDAGYKLIIILAGMHDSLRSQTQIRIDEGFLGFNSQRSLQYSNTNKIGVGFYNPRDGKTNEPIDLPANALTSSHLNGDFNRKVAQSAGIHLRSSDPIVAVIKKNGSILKNIISWLAVWGDKQPDGKIIIRNVPFLLIDDEADNASVNVSKEKVSAINGCIRALLSLFEQSAYVGYTATPFANIFIPILAQETVKGIDLTIKDYEYTVGQDLFPKDFIINIPAPSNYIGPAKVFGLPALTSSDSDEEPLPVLRLVNDYDIFDSSNTQEQFQNVIAGIANEYSTAKSLVPDKHKKDDPLPDELPPSLKYAIKCFVLSATARRVRKQIEVHNSMLIHISRFIVWQDRIATLVDAELKFYQKQIELKSGNLLKELEVIWIKEFMPTTAKIIRDSHIYSDPEIIPVSWKDVETEIYSAISKMEVRAVHGDKNIAGLSHHNISPLDYFFSEQQGKFLSVIAVGGDKLSRGLTLEGLTISYYLRASKMYDTLMQMGRWFGFRPGYVDLCRIFTSDELSRWYKHITIASEEMRKDFDYMFLLKKTPKEFGLKVRTHPGVLKITAANKFRYKKIMYLSYSGELEQTYQFKLDQLKFQKNFDAVIDLISDLGNTIDKPINSFNSKQIFVWKGEDNFNAINTFILKFKIGEEVIDTNKMVDYINAQTKKGNLTNWTVALINNSTAKPEDEYEFSGLSKKVGLTDRTNISNDPSEYAVAKYNITDHRHELIDLSEAEIIDAISKTGEDNKDEGNNDVPELPSRKRIKWKRSCKNGLLLIYPLNHNCQHIVDDSTKPKTIVRKHINDVPIIGIAVSFPENENDEKIEYAVNEQFRKEYEYPEELDLIDSNDGSD
ncbi:MAG TPA: Z1 domain-containing protein [Bacteroidales bacterium]|nr:Z1 domain-containing protein [Bacteroidales bacterium]